MFWFHLSFHPKCNSFILNSIRTPIPPKFLWDCALRSIVKYPTWRLAFEKPLLLSSEISYLHYLSRSLQTEKRLFGLSWLSFDLRILLIIFCFEPHLPLQRPSPRMLCSYSQPWNRHRFRLPRNALVRIRFWRFRTPGGPRWRDFLWTPPQNITSVAHRIRQELPSRDCKCRVAYRSWTIPEAWHKP